MSAKPLALAYAANVTTYQIAPSWWRCHVQINFDPGVPVMPHTGQGAGETEIAALNAAITDAMRALDAEDRDKHRRVEDHGRGG